MANWINRTTYEFKQSWSPDPGDEAAWLDLGPTTPTLLTGSPHPQDWAVVGDEVVLKPEIERVAWRRFIAYAKIGQRTDELIALGHTYLGMQFSTSTETRTTVLAMIQSRDSLAYPIRFNSLDDSGYVDLASAAEVVAFYENGVGTVRARLDSGTALKDQVRAATTLAELDAVVDPR